MRMGSAAAAILTVAILAVWYLRTRRHPGWATCPMGRFYITIGYPAVAIAVCWLSDATTKDGWEWVFGNVWALVAVVMFVKGFDALRDACEQPNDASQQIQTLSAHSKGQK